MTQPELFAELIGFVTKINELEDSLSKEAFSRSVTPQQNKLLRTLFMSESTTLSGLSECMGMSLPNCSREVKKLTEQGYIQKEDSQQDRRITTLTTTPQGNAEVIGVFERMQQSFFTTTGEWDEKRTQETIAAIRVLSKTLF